MQHHIRVHIGEGSGQRGRDPHVALDIGHVAQWQSDFRRIHVHGTHQLQPGPTRCDARYLAAYRPKTERYGTNTTISSISV